MGAWAAECRDDRKAAATQVRLSEHQAERAANVVK
jgi:hypothetical protein